MRLLAFSDVHRDRRQAKRMLVVVETPTVLVPGNNETDDALREACRGWKAATVLHGESTEIDGVEFFGLGGGIPTTPWPWSFDLTEEEAAAKLEGCPDDCVLVVHSPPKGHVDGGRRALGSESILRTVEQRHPRVVVCGHIHESGGEE
ncbi:MAG: serine/threonine protein phosphatase, partial [Actinobacteria bacterium]